MKEILSPVLAELVLGPKCLFSLGADTFPLLVAPGWASCSPWPAGKVQGGWEWEKAASEPSPGSWYRCELGTD